VTPEEWAHDHISPPSFTACGHAIHSNPDVSDRMWRHREGESTCLDCGHTWTEHSIALSNDEYNTLLAYVAFRLDSK